MASQNSLVVIGRASYLNIWEKRAFDRGEPMYSMALLVSKRDKKTLAAIDKAVNAAIEMGKDKYWKGRVPQKFTYPMHDGDIEKPDQKAYRGMMFFNIKCYDEVRRLDEDGMTCTTRAACTLDAWCVSASPSPRLTRRGTLVSVPTSTSLSWSGSWSRWTAGCP